MCDSREALPRDAITRERTVTNSAIPRPDATEYSPYFGRYIALVPDGDLLETLARQLDETAWLLRGVTERGGDFRYADGKWSIKEVVGHLADTERIFAYRALRFARGDGTPLPGFDENLFVANARFTERTLADLMAELRAVRAATIALFSGLAPDELERRGVANGQPMSVRAAAYNIAGHERHHVAILRERYLPALGRKS